MRTSRYAVALAAPLTLAAALVGAPAGAAVTAPPAASNAGKLQADGSLRDRHDDPCGHGSVSISGEFDRVGDHDVQLTYADLTNGTDYVVDVITAYVTHGSTVLVTFPGLPVRLDPGESYRVGENHEHGGTTFVVGRFVAVRRGGCARTLAAPMTPRDGG